MTSLCFFQNTFILRRPRVAIFADIINILSMVIKKIFIKKGSKKVKRVSNHVSKCNLYLYFLIQENLLTAVEKMLISADLKGCVT